MSKERFTTFFKDLQTTICSGLEMADGKGKFSSDQWEREEGGGGLTRVMTGGQVFEKAGVNFSAVHGQLNESIRKSLGIEASGFYATGVSIVIHPVSPHVPIIHMNVRYFELENGERWFGGGIDLTPHYIVEEDARFFHGILKDVCDKHSPSYYLKFREWADNYFFIPHRNETRGIGGIFFDRLKETNEFTIDQRFDFVKDVGNTFLKAYVPLVEKNKHKAFSKLEKNWQLLRRGRYVEFNLVYDKGTRFGLETNGRIESILMSLPELASWQYNVKPEPGSLEEHTAKLLKKGIFWV